MIVADKLSKRFGNILAVDRVSFEVRKGDILGFLGPNGAGKSTTMKLLTGYLTPDSGSASIGGFDTRHACVLARQRLGYLPETGPLYPEMTVEEFLEFMASVRGLDNLASSRALRRAMKLCELGSVRHQVIETLSKGFRQRVGMAQALLHDPGYLILDEPTDGLDPNQKRQMRALIREMATDKAIILSTHILEEVEAMCNRVIIIHEGQVITDESPKQLIQRHPHFGCLRLCVSNRDASSLSEDLRTLGSFELKADGENHWLVRQLETTLAPQTLWQLAREKQWDVQTLETPPLGLDEVFRKLTEVKPTAQPDTAA